MGSIASNGCCGDVCKPAVTVPSSMATDIATTTLCHHSEYHMRSHDAVMISYQQERILQLSSSCVASLSKDAVKNHIIKVMSII